MQNISPLNFLQPVVTILFSFGLVVYWRNKHTFSRYVLIYSLLAYAGAIAAKVVLQTLTASAFDGVVESNLVIFGLYLGLQTVFFEVGGAYLVAKFSISRGKINNREAEAYGLGLSLWENGILLGILPVINLIIYYATLSSNTPASQALYSELVKIQPQLFDPNYILLNAPFGLLERISSLLVHFSWGVLCVLSAVYHERKFLMFALPMGLIDLFVPLASEMPLPAFELMVFVFALGCLWIALEAMRRRVVPASKNESTHASTIGGPNLHSSVSWAGRILRSFHIRLSRSR